jgi:hypothetical protein
MSFAFIQGFMEAEGNIVAPVENNEHQNGSKVRITTLTRHQLESKKEAQHDDRG